MPTDIDHVVHSASDPVKPIFIPSAAIPREIVALQYRHIRVVEYAMLSRPKVSYVEQTQSKSQTEHLFIGISSLA